MIHSKNYDGAVCTLVNTQTGRPVAFGDVVSLSGEPMRVSGGRAPHTSNSTGRVWVADPTNGAEAEYFPSVVEMEWVPDFSDARFMPLKVAPDMDAGT